MSGYDRKRKQEEDQAWVKQLVSDAQRRKWYGTLTIIFEDGCVKRARKDESLFPPSRK